MLGDYVHLKIYHYGELIDTIAMIAAINPREGAVDPTTFNVVFGLVMDESGAYYFEAFHKIQFVHELQNVMRLCGIEKEIKLN